jgi:DNA-binding transcriptional ArsR family regulator
MASPDLAMTRMPSLQAKPRFDAIDRMRTHAEDAAVLLRSVGNPQRLLILCELVEGEVGVGELLERLDLSQSALSQHLAVLREAGLVRVRRVGVQAFYALQDGPVRPLMRTLHAIYCEGELR